MDRDTINQNKDVDYLIAKVVKEDVWSLPKGDKKQELWTKYVHPLPYVPDDSYLAGPVY